VADIPISIVMLSLSLFFFRFQPARRSVRAGCAEAICIISLDVDPPGPALREGGSATLPAGQPPNNRPDQRMRGQTYRRLRKRVQ
jgi:hypothetical protein